MKENLESFTSTIEDKAYSKGFRHLAKFFLDYVMEHRIQEMQRCISDPSCRTVEYFQNKVISINKKRKELEEI